MYLNKGPVERTRLVFIGWGLLSLAEHGAPSCCSSEASLSPIKALDSPSLLLGVAFDRGYLLFSFAPTVTRTVQPPSLRAQQRRARSC